MRCTPNFEPPMRDMTTRSLAQLKGAADGLQNATPLYGGAIMLVLATLWNMWARQRRVSSPALKRSPLS
jgi:hypothetical protein